MAYCITKSFGMANIKANIPKWLAALSAGAAAAPRCTGTTKTGEPCGKTRTPGAERCRHHLHGRERDLLDIQRAIRAEKILRRSSHAPLRAKAETTLRVIARRQLHRHGMTQNPDAPGTTLILSAQDERRIRKHLLTRYQIDLDAYVHDALEPARGLSQRAIDRLRWAASLEVTRRISEQSAGNRVRLALRDDVRWFSKHGW